MFVGDVHNGWIYHFDLNEYRTDLILEGPLADKIANTPEEMQETIFGEGFGGITDLEVGPDGYLYVVSIGQGAIYRIVPGVNGGGSGSGSGGGSGGGGVTTDIDDDEQGEEFDDDDADVVVESEEDNISNDGGDDEDEVDEDVSLEDDDGNGGDGDDGG
jgi:hypothetical protein